MRITNKGLDLIKKFEGCNLSPYLDSAGIPTIGIGSIRHIDGVTRVSMQDAPITPEMAESMLTKHLEGMIKKLDSMVEVDLSENQADAIISLVYNIGVYAFSKSKLLRYLNAGDFVKAADNFLLWDKSGGKTIFGLSRRREAERDLFNS